MLTSIIIPLWNGSAVIKDCLEAVYSHSGVDAFEVICVDNDSQDESADTVAEVSPRTRLIRQPVNLGFAGGVNTGMEAAIGDTFVLLNQDCVVQPGWLEALQQAARAHPQYGIFGCTIYDPEGLIHHTGATILRPEAAGKHFTDFGDGQIRQVDFVTGAAMAIRRKSWETVGKFDEGYYPAYYEDCDYCYRARRKGVETAWVPDAKVRHLFSSRAWLSDPMMHTTNSYTSRYRFVCKHFNHEEFKQFVEAEIQALSDNRYMDHAVGRTIAAHDTLRALMGILERRQQDLCDDISATTPILLREGFSRIHRVAFESAIQLVCEDFPLSAEAKDSQESVRSGWSSNSDQWAASEAELLELRKREEVLFNQLQAPRSLINRLKELYSGRYSWTLIELNSIQLQHLSALETLLQKKSRILQEKSRILELLVEYGFR